MVASILGKDVNTGEDVTLEKEKTPGSTYIIGKAGSGKTTLLVNMILQAIENGQGLCFLDPHEDAITEIIKRLPSHREHDVLLLDLSDIEYAFGLNLFQCDNPQDEIEVSRVTSMVMGVFAKLFTESGDLFKEAPNMAETLQNTIPVLLSHVSPHMTMAEIPLLFINEDARTKLVRPVTNMQVKLFWEQYNRWRSDRQDDLTSSTVKRVRNFLNDPLILKIIGQSETTLPFRRLMDERKILLVKLSRNHELISNLIGSIIVGQIAIAAFARVDTPEENRIPFYLFVDEFQNFATSTFAQILAETRKYRVFPVVAHQWRGQLDKQNREATLNAANLIVYQVSGADAEELANQFDLSPVPGEVRTEHARVISPTPVDTVVLGRPHTKSAVYEFFKPWRELVQTANASIREGSTPGSSSTTTNRRGITKTYSKPGRKWSNRDDVEEAQEQLDPMNSFLFQVMVGKHPLCVVPIDLFQMWRPFKEYAMFPTETTIAGETRQPTDAQLRVYNALWETTDEMLEKAFSTFEQEARLYLRSIVDASLSPFLEEIQQIAHAGILQPRDLLRNLEQQKKIHLDFLDLNALTVFVSETTYQCKTIDSLPITPTLQSFPRPLYLWQWDEASRIALFVEICALIVPAVLEYGEKQARWYDQYLEQRIASYDKKHETIGLDYLKEELSERQRNKQTKYQQSYQKLNTELYCALYPLSGAMGTKDDNLLRTGWLFYFPDPSRPSSAHAPTCEVCSPAKVRSIIIEKIINIIYQILSRRYSSSVSEEECTSLMGILRQKLQTSTFQGIGQYWEEQTQQSEVDIQTSLSLPIYKSADKAANREYHLSFQLHVNPKWLETVQTNLQVEIDRIVAEQKPVFEQSVRDVREVLAILVSEPICELSSVLEEKPVDLSTAEVAARIANTLVNPKQKFTARCKLSDGQEHIIKALPDQPDVTADWHDRLNRIVTNTRLNYCKKRSEVEAEIAERQKALMKPEKKDRRTQQEEE